MLRSVTYMEKVSNFESFISLQLAYCDEFFTFIHEKSDKRKVKYMI